MNRTKALLAACLLAMVTSAAHAEHGRDFSASYTLGSPHAVDSTRVAVPITLQLHNHSGGDVANATLELVGLLGRASPSKQAEASSSTTVPGVTVANRAVVRVTISVTTTKQEYRRWELGGRPYLVLSTRDRMGHQLLRRIEATPSVSQGGAR